MSESVQRRFGTTAEHATFAGDQPWETTIDTTKKTVVVQDGSTFGGFPLAREDQVIRHDVEQALTAIGKNRAQKNIGVDFFLDSRNLLINSSFLINQREYVSGTATSSANQFTLDRWAVIVNGQSLSWSSGDGFNTVTVPAGGIIQHIEGANVISGDHVISWEGTATATVNGNAVAKGDVVSLTGANNVIIRFFDGTLFKPQFELGSVVSDYSQRQVQQEIALCQRYFETVNTYYQWDHSLTAGFGTGFSFNFNVRKRATPSMSVAASALSGWTYSGIDARPEGFTAILAPTDAGPTGRSGGIIFAANAEII